MGAPRRFVHKYCTGNFADDQVYILYGIARKKFNPELTNSQEIVHQLILRDRESIDRKYDRLKALCNTSEYSFRIYLTVNPRDTVRAYYNLRERMNGWMQSYVRGHDEALEKTRAIDNYWKSELHKPEASATSRFLFDLDTTNELQHQRFVMVLGDHTDILESRPTPNGYHIITQPFNHTAFVAPVEYDDLATDGDVYVDTIGDE